MRILVLGAGQSGTCLLTEVVRSLGLVNFTDPHIEDRKLFIHNPLRENYGTKLTTDAIEKLTIENYFNFPKALAKLMMKYKDFYIVFSIRHPLDIFMSQIVRGQKRINGGDSKRLSDTGTMGGSFMAIMHFYNIYQTITETFSGRTLDIKMEDLVLYPRKTVDKIADNFGTKATQKTYHFYKYNRNRYQKKRYGKKLNKSVVGIHEKWKTWGNGFFKDKQNHIILATQFLGGIINGLGYKSWEN